MIPLLRAGHVGLLLCCSANVLAQQDDVTFFVIGKHTNVQQDIAGQLKAVDFSFFSEIFLSDGGEVSDAALLLPDGELISYSDQREAEGGARDSLFLISGEERYSSADDLHMRYPNGTYQVAFDTPSGAIPTAELVFADNGLPDAPTIALHQNGAVRCNGVSADEDLNVSWSAFSLGRADDRGVIDDLIFVILTDANGVRIAHSGRPFEGKPFLTYADNEYVINADSLQADQTYELSVEHAVLDDTRMYQGIRAMTTQAVTTNLAIYTVAESAIVDEECTLPSPSIDSATVMFYYKDLAPAVKFYGEVLGLENTLDWDWVKMFKTGPASTLGLVKEGEGAFHKAQPRSAVMLSLVTTEIDGWYARLKQRDDVTFVKKLQDGVGIRAFLLEDPGGYSVEFFEWGE